MEEQEPEIVNPQSSEKQITILVFGKHEYILTNVENLLQKAGYGTKGFTEVVEILDFMRNQPFDGVLIGGGVEPHDRSSVKELVSKEFSHAKVVEHFGGPATILPEVQAAFKS